MTTAQTTQNWKSIFRKFGWGYLCVLFSVALLCHSVSMWFNTRTTDTWLDPKFSKAQSHIPIPNRKFCKLYEHFSFFRKNHGLGIHSDKTWADTSTKNTLKYITTYSADLPNRLKYLGYLKKTSHWVSIVRDVMDFFFQLRLRPFSLEESWLAF